MKQALVVNILVDHILLSRTDPGSLLVFNSDSTGCLIESVDGKRCNTICRRQKYSMTIEPNRTGSSRTQLPTAEGGRNAV